MVPGELGELWFQYPGVELRSYYDNVDANRSTFRDGWIRTGDIGILDADGYCDLVDRREDTIIRGIQRFILEKVGSHQVPHTILFVESLPRNHRGKILKRELRRLASEDLDVSKR